MVRVAFSDLPDWARRYQIVTDAVVGQSTSDALASIEVAQGITRGGSRVPGTIPRDLGALAASLQSTLYGGTAFTHAGTESYVLVAGAMRAGDLARFSWGGPTAPYARVVHDGARGVPGTHWIDAMANKWPAFVTGAVRKVKAELAP